MASPALAVSQRRSIAKKTGGGDWVAHLVTLGFAAMVIAVTMFLVWELWLNSAVPRAKFGFSFLTSSDWDNGAGQFGALSFIYGTVLTSFLALIMAAPLGIGAAIFLAELAPPRLSDGLTFVVELLAAIPSVIYGLLAIFTLLPLMRLYIEPFLKKTLGFLPIFQGYALGVSYLSAGVILAIMSVPFIISISREALREVPRDQREAALALGATTWEATSQVVVPYARLGILGSTFLALARALGETMAVIMVIGNSPGIHISWLSPGYTIAGVVASEFAEATGDLYLGALVELGLVLFLLTMVINGLARLLVLATTRKGTAHAA